jgi:hypothetical protein
VFCVLAIVEQHGKPRARIQAEMVPALATHAKRLFEILFPDDFAASVALQPQPFGSHCALG